MIFWLVSKNENTTINPLIKGTLKKISNLNDGIYIIDSFEYAFELGFTGTNYLNQEIYENIFWTDNIDETIKMILIEKCKNNIIEPLFTTKYLDDEGKYYAYENDRNIILYNRYKENIKIFEKTISSYFEYEIDREELTTYENFFRREIKKCGFVEKEYILDSIILYLKKLFADKYFYYLGIIFETINATSCVFINCESWDNLFRVEKYFNNVRIYGLDQSAKHDFNFQKDEDGKYYVQYEYNASETATGRMFPVNQKGYQSLQTLPKESRGLLKAESGCMLIEYDYKNFELSLFQHFYEKIISGGCISMDMPHERICDLLGISPYQYRSFGKTINYAIIYGMNLSSLTTMICEKFPEKEYINTRSILKNYELYDAAETLSYELSKKIVESNGKLFIENGFGRGIKIEKEHALLNNYIQSSAADYVYKKICDILDLFEREKLPSKNKLLLQNHDSILIQLETSIILKRIIPGKIHQIMISSVNNIACEVDMKSGEDWGTLS